MGRRSTNACVLLGALVLTVTGCGRAEIDEPVLREAIDARLESVTRDREWTRAVLDSTFEARANGPLWTGRKGLSRQGRRLIEALEGAADEGLDPRLYAVDVARGLEESLEEIDDPEARASELARVEVELSLGLVEYSRDLVRGRLEPSEGREEWRIDPEPLPANPLLRIADGEKVGDLLDSLRPQAPYYDRLVRALADLREVEASGGWPAVGQGPTPEVGDRGERVRALRARLAVSVDPEERRLAGLAPESRSDGFDERLAEALSRFQRRHGLEPDGVLGPATVRELDTPVEIRIESIMLNLDRLRWLPRDFGPRAILVNVAGFELELLEDNAPELEMNVVVGREEWATRLFTEEMDHIVLNPYWNVPGSIVATEVAPAVRNDPGYLARNGYEVLAPDGTAIDLGDVDWGGEVPVAESDGAVVSGLRVRQAPGRANALGRVKFMFPNPYHIYLHDSPADHLFSRAYRAFSHGCIRVEQPIRLAREIVARYTDRSPDEVDAILESGKTVTIPLDRPVPVYIAYLTAWVEDDGVLYFYRDVYDRDEALHEIITEAPSREPEQLARGSRSETRYATVSHPIVGEGVPAPLHP